MEIRHLRVTNIRSFVHADARLRSGTTLLWGDVGTGKTSLLYAIEMALFGFAEVDGAFLIRHGAKTAEVALTLEDDGHEYTFFRRFSRRTRKGRDTFDPDEKGTGLTKDGVTTLYPPTELRRRAIDLLGFPDNPNPRAHSDLWRWAVYVPQERMRQILEPGDSGARLQTVRKAFGLERYRTAADNAELLARSLRKDAEARAREMALLDHWTEDLARQTARLHESEEAHELADSAADSLRRTAKDVEDRLLQTEERRRRRAGEESALMELGQRTRAGLAQEERLERTAAELDRRRDRLAEESEAWDSGAVRRSTAREGLILLERAKSEIEAELQRLEPVELSLAAAEAELRAGSEYERDAVQSVERSRSASQAARERLDRARHEGPANAPVAPTPKGQEEIETELSSAGTLVESLGGEVHHLEAERAELAGMVNGGVCSRCGQAVTTALIGQHEAEVGSALARAQAAYATASHGLKRLKDERAARERFDRVRASWEAAEARRETVRLELERTEAELRRSEKELGARRAQRERSEGATRVLTPQVEKLRAVRARGDALERERRGLAEAVAEIAAGEEAARAREVAFGLALQDGARTKAERAEVAALLGSLKTRMAEIEASLGTTELVEAELVSLREERRRLETELGESIGRLHRADAEQAAARERVSEAERGVLERARIEAEADRMRRLAEFLLGPFREQVLALEHRLLGRAQGEFDRSFSRFFAALLEDPSLVARSDAGFDPWVEIEGEATPAEALSGGERTALALAYRLALSEVVRGAGRLRLATLLLDEPTDGFSPEQVQRMGELLAELGIPQLILVSHEVLLGGAADHVVQVRKVGGASSLEEERAAPRSSARIEQRPKPVLVPGR